MKRFFAAFFAAVLLLLCACSNPAKDSLKSYADMQNKSCPQPVDDELILTGYDYSTKENVFSINYSVREVGGTVGDMRKSEGPLRRIIGQNFRNESLHELLEMLLKADASMQVSFTGEITGDTFLLDFGSAALDSISAQAGRELSDVERLGSLIANENSRCPQYINGDSLVIASMTIEEPYIVLTFSYNTEAYNFAKLSEKELRAKFEPGLRQIYESGAGREQLLLMRKLGLGMCYRFCPTDSTPAFSMTIPANEL